MANREIALISCSSGDGLAVAVDVLTGTQVTTLKNCSALPGSTALIAGDFVASAQVHVWDGRVCQRNLCFLQCVEHGVSVIESGVLELAVHADFNRVLGFVLFFRGCVCRTAVK